MLRDNRVHPRSRGAAATTRSRSPTVKGPSPLARGSQECADGVYDVDGSIPARAGQPASTSRSSPPARVHPRSRGAAAGIAECAGVIAGPSPLARGSLHRPEQPGAVQGSIPARAGQPATPLLLRGLSGVHPRSRGAADMPWVRENRAQGPSPLARGSRSRAAPRTPRTGSIPARAGQPPSTRCRLGCDEVHPRSRGAAKKHQVRKGIEEGPSPLARGSHDAREL